MMCNFINCDLKVTIANKTVYFPLMPSQTVSGSRRRPMTALPRRRYVATLSGDLAAIARRHGLTTLGYLLDMARLEAENESRPSRVNGR